MNLLTKDYPRMKVVFEFERKRIKKGSSSVITDAIRYAKEDFNVTFEPLENNFMVHFQNKGELLTTSKNK